MKTIKRRAFCKAAAAAVAGVLAPHAAAEALLPQAAQAVVGSAVPEDYYSFAFRSDHSETDLSHDFYYTDAFFENTALQYSHKLALATLGLVAASGNTYQSDALYWVEGEAGREDSIADAYQKLGFANAVYAGYQCSLNTPVDTAGCAFAQKTLVHHGQHKRYCQQSAQLKLFFQHLALPLKQLAPAQTHRLKLCPAPEFLSENALHLSLHFLSDIMIHKQQCFFS